MSQFDHGIVDPGDGSEYSATANVCGHARPVRIRARCGKLAHPLTMEKDKFKWVGVVKMLERMKALVRATNGTSRTLSPCSVSSWIYSQDTASTRMASSVRTRFPNKFQTEEAKAFCLRRTWSRSPFLLIDNRNGGCDDEQDSTNFQCFGEGGDCEAAFGRRGCRFRMFSAPKCLDT